MSARSLLLIALPLTFVVVVVGAFVRLTDAGLGCPDWPGCYGKLIGVADAEEAAAAYPDSPYDLKKAWIEVGHRYIAGLLGLLLCAAAVVHWRSQRRFGIALLLPPLVLLQAGLGMLTVTKLLKPLIVTSHLLGGMLILGLAAAAVARKPLSVVLTVEQSRSAIRWWRVGLVVLVLQLALGGWVSTNYAGLACPQFPLCQKGWLPPQVDFSGFALERELHVNADGTPVTAAALATIHFVHRVMALVLTLVFGVFIALLWRGGARGEAKGLAVFLSLQLALGVVNVIWQLPLWAAVAHNAFAGLLVVNMAVIGVKLTRSAAADAAARAG